MNNCHVIRVHTPEKFFDIFESAGDHSHDQIGKHIKKVVNINVKTLANALLDLSAERFQILAFYSFVVKPPK